MNIKQDILGTLAYFDIFDYPITQSEIFQFLRNKYSNEEFLNGLHLLVIENWVHNFDEFYTLQDDCLVVPRRRQGNIKARGLLKTAGKIAGFLSSFPFVRGVAVSGSLSKNFADENSDIDFFIITAKNKLWLARTFMHLFKKFSYFFKKQHWFCMNYYVSDDMLQIKEKNIYTAVEIATLLPLRGIETFQNFYTNNKWSRKLLPNHSLRVSYTEQAKNPFFKRTIEVLFSNAFGDWLDDVLMKLTAYRWRKKTKNNKLNKRGIVMSMDVSKHYAKPSPENFQKKLLNRYEKKISMILCKYESKAKVFIE